MHLNTRRRYSYKRVLAVCTIIVIALTILQLIAISLLPTSSEKLKTFFKLHTLISMAASLLCMSLFYYFMINAYYRLIAMKKKAKRYVLVSLVGIVVYAAYSTVSFQFSEEANRPEYTLGVKFISIMITTFFSSGIALLIAYLTVLRDEQKQRKVLEKQKMELEVQNSQANFNFLKAQINPHFLHNTLNFFYAKALPLSAELSEGILCLADIMRYALNEGGKDEKALLKDEITHLENVIRINQLRFSNNLNVQFEIKGEVGNAMIVPFVLITLVENAFKHGDIRSQAHPIIILIEMRGKGLYFYCRNKKKTGFKEISTGIGLPNILKRLQFAYGDGYNYNVKDEDEFYTTELTISEL